MKYKNIKYLKTFLIFMLFLFVLYLIQPIIVVPIFMYKMHRICVDLEEISNDKDKTAFLWNGVSHLLDDYKYIKSSKLPYGALFYHHIGDRLYKIDWNKMDIQEDIANIEFKGKNLRYPDFDPALIEEIRLGRGYRFHLVYKIENAEDLAYRIDNNLDLSGVEYKVTAECRHKMSATSDN